MTDGRAQCCRAVSKKRNSPNHGRRVKKGLDFLPLKSIMSAMPIQLLLSLVLVGADFPI